jgi:hypothetical protein
MACILIFASSFAVLCPGLIALHQKTQSRNITNACYFPQKKIHSLNYLSQVSSNRPTNYGCQLSHLSFSHLFFKVFALSLASLVIFSLNNGRHSLHQELSFSSLCVYPGHAKPISRREHGLSEMPA